MKMRILVILVTMLFITMSIVGAVYNTSKNDISLDGPPRNFEQRFNSINVSDVNGSDFTNSGWTGHIRKVNDTNKDKELSKCDYVYIEWKNPKTRRPHHKCHVKEVWVHLEPRYYIVKFDFKNSKRNPHRESSSNNYYVDDNNIVGPWYGTRENPFRYIQDGIDAAGSGDAICVFPGIYNENILVDKNDLTIKPETCRPWGEPAEECIVDGGGTGSVITVNNDWVYLYGFKVRNSGNQEEDAGIDLRSDNNTIFGNNIEDNQNGIYLHESSNQNDIYENFIENNVWGLFIWDSSNNNMIYNNNFIENTGFHVKDKCENNWNWELPYGGNFWDDYIGSDIDGDGIGDSSYQIQGGENQDNYPLINPWINKQPETPFIDGPDTGKPGENLTYTFTSLDPNEDDMQLEIEWGDGSTGLASYDSGEDIIFNHTWQDEGTYIIKAKAIDFYNAESDWAFLEVSMPKNKAKTIDTLLLRLLDNYPLLYQILKQFYLL
jgi:parallel beta-helix repeat protein